MPDGAPPGVVAPGAPGPVCGGRSADRCPWGGGAGPARRGPGPRRVSRRVGLDRGVFPRPGGPQARPPVQPGPSRTQVG